MRLLVVGGTGMLGHKLWQIGRETVETWATVRDVTPALEALGLVDDRTIAGIDVTQPDALEPVLNRVRPDAVVNCVGVTKKLVTEADPVPAIAVNALFPHLLARACRRVGARLVHISTDCVFDGRAGNRREDELPDAEDLYGRTKALGEVTAAGALTIRTSIIGRELAGTTGLVEWFLSRRGGDADGYAGAVFSGFTTAELSRVILRVIARHPELEGLYHVSAAAIDKHTLLTLLNDAFDARVTIARRDEPVIDRSLDSSRFRARTGYEPPSWPAMIEELAADATPYDAVRVPA